MNNIKKEKIETINDYFPLIDNGTVSAEDAADDAIKNGMTYAMEYFSPSDESELAYWKMIRTQAWKKYKQSEKEKTEKASQKYYPIETVKCDCGCTIPKSQKMAASLGSSCPNCYDDMSD
jgi:hypothetical protein